LVAEWQLLADLSFADLTLWVPIRNTEKSWPEGFLAIAHIRPTTAATVFTHDEIGREITWGANPRLEEALASGEIVRDNVEDELNGFKIKEEAIPVQFQSEVIAVISRIRNIETMKTPSKLELNYREIANQIYKMIAQGNFPIAQSHDLTQSAPRVGDGLIRLGIDGSVLYASPNALSALNRLGWQAELQGHNLGEVIESISDKKSSANISQASDESWRSSVSGRVLRRREFENDRGSLDILSIPLLEGQNRIGAMVLIQNVTELRRRERALLSKDATIREIHHRVKNNLQTVSALLRLQARRIDDPAARQALDEAVRRVAAIALVHETLASNTAEKVEFDGVLDQILRSEVHLGLRGGEIHYRREGLFGELSSQIATPLALILTELIHNAIEHGLSVSGDSLTINCLRSENSTILVSVVDNGSGISSEFSLESNANLGLEIVRTLTENELQGELNFYPENPGTRVKIRFPI
jgi:two-component system, sensor histidine kinase PdtaS